MTNTTTPIYKIETTRDVKTGTIWTQIWDFNGDMISSFISDNGPESLDKAYKFLSEYYSESIGTIKETAEKPTPEQKVYLNIHCTKCAKHLLTLYSKEATDLVDSVNCSCGHTEPVKGSRPAVGPAPLPGPRYWCEKCKDWTCTIEWPTGSGNYHCKCEPEVKERKFSDITGKYDRDASERDATKEFKDSMQKQAEMKAVEEGR